MKNIQGIRLKPCPFCGSSNLSLSWETSFGHGDSGYSHLRVVCEDCDATQGGHGYGQPDNKAMEDALNAWNRRLGEGFEHQPIIKDENDEPLDHLKRLFAKYGERFDILSYLKEFNTDTQ